MEWTSTLYAQDWACWATRLRRQVKFRVAPTFSSSQRHWSNSRAQSGTPALDLVWQKGRVDFSHAISCPFRLVSLALRHGMLHVGRLSACIRPRELQTGNVSRDLLLLRDWPFSLPRLTAPPSAQWCHTEVSSSPNEGYKVLAETLEPVNMGGTRVARSPRVVLLRLWLTPTTIL